MALVAAGISAPATAGPPTEASGKDILDRPEGVPRPMTLDVRMKDCRAAICTVAVRIEQVEQRPPRCFGRAGGQNPPSSRIAPLPALR